MGNLAASTFAVVFPVQTPASAAASASAVSLPSSNKRDEEQMSTCWWGGGGVAGTPENVFGITGKSKNRAHRGAFAPVLLDLGSRGLIYGLWMTG